MKATNFLRDLRRSILFWADADLEPVRLLDSFPMPLCACYRIHQSTQPWMQPISGTSFGWNDSKKNFFFGLHLCLVLTASGFISVLTKCFGIEHMRARSDAGIYRRTQAKATAFSLACYFNTALGLDTSNVTRYAIC